ncbi:MAG: UvrB/UvrC motif-containing protein [Candidatus Andersenbacteria bacterium]
MVRKIADLETIFVGSELEALILESTLIKKYSPRYNVLLKDDKNYLFIKVTVREDFPQVLTVRRVTKDGARYFGPFTSAFAVRQTLKLMQRIFPYRTCDLPLVEGQILGHGFKPCLRYHLGRCDAPCVEGIGKVGYRAAIDRVILFLEGKLDVVRAGLVAEMQAAANAQDYERAAQLRDQVAQLRREASGGLVAALYQPRRGGLCDRSAAHAGVYLADHGAQRARARRSTLSCRSTRATDRGGRAGARAAALRRGHLCPARAAAADAPVRRRGS